MALVESGGLVQPRWTGIGRMDQRVRWQGPRAEPGGRLLRIEIDPMDADSSAWSSEEPSSAALFSGGVVLSWADPGTPPALRGRVLNHALHGFSGHGHWARLGVVLDSFHGGRRAHGLVHRVGCRWRRGWRSRGRSKTTRSRLGFLLGRRAASFGSRRVILQGRERRSIDCLRPGLSRHLRQQLWCRRRGGRMRSQTRTRMRTGMRSPVETAEPHHVLAHRAILHLKDLNRYAVDRPRLRRFIKARACRSACGIGGRTGLEGGGLDGIKGAVRCTGGDEAMSAAVPSE
ncbi:Uncharacterized protein TCAP_04732 [Tolypocladium capitatum]|uniref:Uncharacterized protein n=1 Tax=Tolypocladium capitatum TaxID=45235 RepID=A0A2K3QCQ4_9HYPO|nr:Uncharacterized protein TCAP_04732 [Tolypocladium capitatum]